MMLLTLRGTPFLYYGEELGMTDGEIPPDRVVDVDGRDPQRTPMQWDGSPGGGFTTGDPWLPLAANHRRVNVAAQRDDPASMLSLYRRLIWYRKRSAALRWGAYRPLPDAPADVFAYLREADGERLLVALNFGGEPLAWASDQLPAGAHLELSTDPARPGGPVRLQPLELGGDEGLVLRLP
jgi:alpha-glucosidase